MPALRNCAKSRTLAVIFMKTLLFILFFAIPFASQANSQYDKVNCPPSFDTVKQITKSKFIDYFKPFDSGYLKRDSLGFFSVSCSWGTYKLVDTKYIIWVNTEKLPHAIGKYYEINIQSKTHNKMVEVLVYGQNDATLANICTDMLWQSKAQPTHRINPLSGTLVISLTEPQNKFDMFEISVLIKNLLFIDPITQNKIEVKNEVIWKAIYQGIPG